MGPHGRIYGEEHSRRAGTTLSVLLNPFVSDAEHKSFHPQKELLPFYRYIRIDFLSYYGNEYFCPISLLRVYGLTQMEEWKSDVWKAEWEAVQPSSSEAMPESTVIALEGRPTSLGVNETPGPNPTKSAQIVSDRSNPSPSPSPLTESIGSTFLKSSSSEHVQAPTPDISDTATPILPVEPIETIVARSVPITTSVSSTTIATSPLSRNEADTNAAHLEPANISPETPPQSTQADTATKEEENLTPITSLDLPVTTSAGSMTSSGSNQNPPAESPQTVTRTISTTIVLSAASPSGTNTALIPSGESVYRMIINRLNGLETNQTLYAKYFEEQGKIVSVRMKRLEEDLGRLSGIVSRLPHPAATRFPHEQFGVQVSSHQQHVSKLLERHRLDLESEHQKLALQVESLAHEVCILVAKRSIPHTAIGPDGEEDRPRSAGHPGRRIGVHGPHSRFSWRTNPSQSCKRSLEQRSAEQWGVGSRMARLSKHWRCWYVHSAI